jgi:hypothetical protein
MRHFSEYNEIFDSDTFTGKGQIIYVYKIIAVISWMNQKVNHHHRGTINKLPRNQSENILTVISSIKREVNESFRP